MHRTHNTDSKWKLLIEKTGSNICSTWKDFGKVFLLGSLNRSLLVFKTKALNPRKSLPNILFKCENWEPKVSPQNSSCSSSVDLAHCSSFNPFSCWQICVDFIFFMHVWRKLLQKLYFQSHEAHNTDFMDQNYILKWYTLILLHFKFRFRLKMLQFLGISLNAKNRCMICYYMHGILLCEV